MRLTKLIRYAACVMATMLAVAASSARAEPVLHHVHGLAFSPDGRSLIVPSHYGLALWRDARWSKLDGPQHDYMGFAVTRRFFFSSGHPAPDLGLVNPLGLMKSADGGRNWRKLGLEGESDFHLLAASYDTDAVYVFNPQPNSRMRRAGIYSTRNDGLSWRVAKAQGLAGRIAALAVHAADANVVAAATSEGLYISEDSGESFRAALKDEQVVAALFDLDGRHLWVSSVRQGAVLSRLDWRAGARMPVALPPLERDAVAYIAQNPAARDELAIATFERSVFVSKNAGKSWVQIADKGRGK
ncbi:MAG: F510_1955 family glycosylhydrolase [Burkholderiales bacterium]